MKGCLLHMIKKIICCAVVTALLTCFLCSCDTNPVKNNSSGISVSEEMVVGSANEGGYPHYNSSVAFSDVSVNLTSDLPSNESTSSGKGDSSSEKSSSKTPSQSSTSKPSSSSKKPTSANQTSSVLQDNSTVNHNTVKAIWISYIDYSETLGQKNESQFRSSFKTICQNCKDFGLNTIICQVRAFGDAFYPSEYFAWSRNVAGIGKNPGYDPLKIMVEIAHSYGLSFHAWLNPYRAYLDSEVASVPSTATFKKWYNDSTKNGKYIIKFSNRWYFNPGEPEVRKLILNGVKEIINNYDVDGIHFDDYFYPQGISASFDSAAYSSYGGGKTLANWRQENVTTLVKSVYDAIKAKNKNIIFGISPQGNIDNNMNVQYADVKLWCANNGYIDYICPQIYYSYKSESLNFSTSLSQWNKLVTASNVELMVGLAPYRIGGVDTWACINNSHTESTANCGKYAWQTKDAANSNILAKQCTDSLSLKKCGGVFLYTYQSVFNIDKYFSASGYASNAVSQAKTEMANLKNALK